MGRRLDEEKARAEDCFGLRIASVVLEEALGELTPEGQIAAGPWDRFTEMVNNLLGGEVVDHEHLFLMRQALDALEADSAEGEHVLCAAKMALSAFLLAGANPFSALLDKRTPIHNDIDPLVRKAVDLLEWGLSHYNGDFAVRYEAGAIEQLNEQIKTGYMQQLIKNAVRPGEDWSQQGWSNN